MVWNHPKETSICISYGRMFHTPGAVGVRKLGEEQQSEEDGRQPQFGKQAGAFYIAGGFFSTHSETHWLFGSHLGNPPNPFRAFFLGGVKYGWKGEIQREMSTNVLLYCLCAHF